VVAKRYLRATDEIRLSIALNFSVFCYEVLKDLTRACNLAKEAFDSAREESLEDFNEKKKKDTMLTL
jgi:hypothetical protein